jgi:Ca2+-binding RTX toxin-like protein
MSGRRVRQLESLEARHLLFTAQIDPDVAGKLGDVVRVELPVLLGNVQNPAEGELRYSLVGQPTDGEVALAPDGQPLSDHGQPFSELGVFYYIPEIDLPSSSPSEPGEGTTDATLNYQVDHYDREGRLVETSYQGTINFSIFAGLTNGVDTSYSTHGTDAVTTSAGPLSIYRQQQRLAYLGYRVCPLANRVANDLDQCQVNGTGQEVPPEDRGQTKDLDVNPLGTLDLETQWAFGVFNAAVRGQAFSENTTEVDSLWLNSDRAPRWRDLPMFGTGYQNLDIGGTNSWGTDWAVAVIEAAGAAYTASGGQGSMNVDDISYRSGGDHPSHNHLLDSGVEAHESGMDIDVHVAETFPSATHIWYDVAAAQTNLNSNSPFWLEVAFVTPNDNIVTEQDARLGITRDGDYVAGGDESNRYAVDGWNIDRTLSALYGHRGTGDAYDLALQARGTAHCPQNQSPCPPLNLFDLGFDHTIAAKKSVYDRTATFNQMSAFVGLNTTATPTRILFNDPWMVTLWNGAGTQPPMALAQGHANHFEVNLRPPSAMPAGSVGTAVGGLSSMLDGVVPTLPTLLEGLAGSPSDGPAPAPSIQDLIGPAGLPFISDTLDDILDIDGVVNDFLRQLVERAIVTGVAAPALNLASAQRLQVVIEGGDPFEITLDAGSYLDVDALAVEIDEALTEAGLDDLLEGGNASGNLTIGTIDEGLATNLVVTTLRLEGSGADVDGFQLTQTNADAVFTIEVERIVDDIGTTETTQHQVTIRDTSPTQEEIEEVEPLVIAHANDNVDIHDLIDDMNSALLMAEDATSPGDPLPLLDVVARRKGTSGDFVLVPTAPEIVRIRVTGLSGQEEDDLGLVNNGDICESFHAVVCASPFTSPLSFIGTRHTPDLVYDDINDLMPLLEGIFNEISDTPLPGDFDVDPVYDAGTDSMLFNFQVNRDFSESVDLDFNEGIDLGPLGRLEILGEATAGVSGSFTLDFRMGIYLGGLGADFTFDASTPLAELNGGNGVPIDVGVTATNFAPGDGHVGANVSFSLEVNGVAHAVSLDFNDTTNNFDSAALAEDLNERALHNTPLTAFTVGDLNGDGDADRLDDVLQFTVDGSPSRLVLNATHSLVNSLELNDTSNLALLGFTNGQTGNVPDLVITDGSGTYNVDLDGAQDVGDVEAAIEAAAPNVDVTIDGVNKRLVLVTSVGTLAAAQPTEVVEIDPCNPACVMINVPTSTAGIALGITAAPGTNTIEGMPLHGATNEDRLFLVEGDPGDDNVTLDLNVDASGLALSAGLGILSFDLAEEVGSPLTFGVELAARLLDPDTSSPDGRITIQEVAEAVTEGRFDDLADIDPPTFNADGTLVLSVPLLADLTNSSDDFVTFAIGITDPTDITTLTFDVDVNESALEGLKNLSVEQIMAIVRDLVNELRNNDTIPWLNEEIPLVDKSLADLIGYLDTLLEKIDEIASVIDSEALEEKLQDIESAVGNVDLPFADPAKQGLLRAVDRVRSVLNELELGSFGSGSPSAPSGVAPSVDIGDPARLPARLVAVTRDIRKRIEALPLVTPGRQDLLDALDAFEELVPDLERLEERLEDAVETGLEDAFGSALDVTVYFDLVDYNCNTAAADNALVIGLIIDGTSLVSEDFEPDLSVPDLGPIEFDLNADAHLYAGGKLSLGFGFLFDDVIPTTFVIVDPPSAGCGVNPELVETRLDLNAGFDGNLSGSVGFGELELIEGEIDLSLLADAQDATNNMVQDVLTVVGGAVTLESTPLLVENPPGPAGNVDERLMIVKEVGGSVLDHTKYTVSGTTLTFGGDSGVSNGDMVTVAYRTSTVGNLAADPTKRASLAVTLNNTPAGNTLGAVPLTSVLTNFDNNIDIDALGILTGALDATFLNNTQDNVVTLAVSLNDITDPQFNVDDQALADMFTNIDFDLTAICEGIEALLGVVEDGLTSEIINKLPIVGDGLNTAGTFIGKMREDYVAPFCDFLGDIGGSLDAVKMTIQQEVFALLGPSGIDILGDRGDPGSDIDLEDVEVELDEEHFQIVVTLSGGDETFVNFDTNLDGLVFEVETDGGVRVGWDYEIDFGVGVDKSEGFYFVTNSGGDPEFSFDLDIGLAVDNSGVDPIPTSLDLSLFGILHLTATDMLQPDGTRGTGIGGMLSLDVSPSSGNRLLLADIGSMEFHEVFEASLSASANLAMELALEIDNNLPSIRTNLMGGIGVTVSTAADGIDVDFAAPMLAFKNIRLDLGDFIGRHIGPVLQDVDEFVRPIKPVIDFLLTEVPGLTQLSILAGQGPVTFLDLVFAKYPDKGAATKKFIGIVKQVIDLITAVAAVSSDDNVSIPFGDLTLGDTRSDAWRSGPLGSLINGQDPEEAVNGSGNGDVAKVFQALQREPDEDGNEGLGIRLDILDPSNIIKLLIGQRANIITWDIPKFDFGLSLDFEFHPIAIVYPFTVTIGFDFGAFADLSVGYDTRGIETGDFFDGFFFGDRESVDQGLDIAEFGLLIGARLRAELDLFIASAGIEGALVATIDANWRDVDDDGKMYLDEIAGIVQSDGIECLFDLTGELRAIIRLVWSILGAEDSKDILDVLIFRFQNECPKYHVAHVVTADDDGESLPGGFTSQEGDLILHSGAFADMRQPGVTTDVAETFTIQRMADGVVEIVGMGFTQRYPDVQRIYADLGDGADRLELIDVTDMPAFILGGEENDIIIGADMADTIDGGGGADTITAGGGDDNVTGGGGADLIDTGDGADTVTAGDGNDTVTTGVGSDSIDAGGGNDSIVSDVGDDSITAGDGDDSIASGDDEDEIYGDGGTDTIHGGDDPDLIFGGAQNDTILGQQGNDTIDGGPGRDYIEGNEGADSIDGNSGFDKIYGHIGNDSIRGGSGHDLIEAHEGNDTIVGDHDNDLIIGEEGNDRIYGGFGHDVIYSYVPGDTNDPIQQGHRVEGGPDDDFICGTTQDDDLWGGTFENNVDGGFDLYWDEWTDEGYPTIIAGGFTPAACEVDEEPEFDDPGFVSISGRKFEDKNADGDDESNDPDVEDDPGLGGFVIIVLDDDGEEVARTTTAPDGTYLIDELDPGTYSVIEEAQSGFRQTFPDPDMFDDEHVFSIDGGESATGIDFGNFRLASVHGVKWEDRDGDGVRDDDEPGLEGWTIYVDYNDNGMLDYDPDVGCLETCTVTMGNVDDPDDPADDDIDETGMYWLENIEPGDWWIREVEQPDWQRTFPVVNTLQRDNFEQLAVDRDWSSTVTAGQLDIDRTPAANRGFLGPFGNETVTLALEGIDPEHSQIDISFDLFILGSWNGNSGGPNGPDRFMLSADDGGGPSTLVDTTFSNAGANNQAYPDDFGMGSHPAFTGAEEINTLGYGGGSAVYHFDFSIAHAATELSLDFTVLRLPPGITSENWGLDNVRVTFPVTGHKVNLSSGESIEEIDFGNRQTGGEIHGTKWLDIDGDGVRDPNEPGLGGVKVFLDTNGNGTLDAGEPMTTTKNQVFNDINHDGVVGLFDVSMMQSQLGQCSPAGGRLSADLDGDLCVTRGDVRTIVGGFKSISGLDSETEVVESAPLFGLAIDVMPATQTGEYWFTDLPAGTYTVLEVAPPGLVQTFPTSDHVVELDADEVVTGINFGNSRSGEIHGKKCEDLNVNGRCDFSTAVGGGEPGIAGVTIFADYNGNGKLDPGEPSTQTMADDPATSANEAGMYWLDGVRPGPAQICEVVPAGYVQVFPAAGCYPVNVQPGQVVNGLDFGNRGRGEIHGTKWDDLNGNRRRDPGERGLPGVTVYLDVNNNSQFETNEPFATTMQDNRATPEDESGMYWLTNVPGGRNFVREVVPQGLTQTFPIGGAHVVELRAGQVVKGRDFGNTGGGEIHGLKWEDRNGNGIQDTGAAAQELGMPGVTIFVDLDGDGGFDAGEPSAVTMQDVAGTPQNEAGMYWIMNVPPGTRRVCEVVPQGFRQTFPPTPPSCHTVNVVSGQPVEGVDFGNQRTGGEIHGTKWFDRNGNGQRDTGGPAGPEPGMPDVTICIDTNHNGRCDSGEPSAVTMRDDTATPQDESGMYWLLDVPAGTHAVCEVVPQGFRQTFPEPIPPGCHTVTVNPGQVVNGLNFGNTRDDGQIRGTKWNDINGNGQRDTVPGVGLEPGVAGVTIYIDANNNGELNAGEPSTTTMADNPTTTTVNEAGMYTLVNVAPGTHRVREVVPVGSVQTFPAANAPHNVTVQSGQTVTGIDFGNRQPPPSFQYTSFSSTDPSLRANGRAAATQGRLRVVPGVPVSAGSVWRSAAETFVADYSFSTRFSFEISAPAGAADADGPGGEGMTFTIQNSAAGATALGDPGGALGIGGIAPAFVVEFDSFLNAALGDGSGSHIGVDFPMVDTELIESVALPRFNSGGTLTAWVDYDGSLDTLRVYLNATTTKPAAPILTLPGVDLGTMFAGDHTLFVGFTAATSSAMNNHDIVAWSFTHGVPVGLSPEPQAEALVAPAPGGPPLTFPDCYTFNPPQPLLVSPAGVLMNDITMGGPLAASLITPPAHGTLSLLPNGAFGYIPNATFTGTDSFTYRATDTTNGAASGPTTVTILGAASGITALHCSPSVHGRKWQDNNGNGKQDAGEPAMPGVTIYADLDSDGVQDATEPFTVTMTDIPATPANENGMYWLSGLPPTVVRIREVVPSGMTQTYPVDPPYHQVLLHPGQTVQNLNFGNRPLEDGEIHGKKCEDRNENRQCDFGTAVPGTEPGVAGVKIYADLNGNHQPDANEPMTVTMQDNPQTPADETGMYWLTGVPPGTWQICEVTPPGWRQTFPIPVPPGCHTVVITAGGVVEGLNFGNVPDRERGEIHGMKWNDKQGALGSHGASEEGVVGVDIYLDMNNNGKLDAGEPTTQTMGDVTTEPNLCDPSADPMCGMYWFVGLPAGVYHVREVVPEDCVVVGLSEEGYWEVYPSSETPPPGFVPMFLYDCVQSFPLGDGGHTINLLPGQIREGVDFGNYEPIVVPDGRDEIHGSDDNDVIKGDNELIEPRTISLGHDDELFGEDDDDELDGQDENDTMWGGEGDDDITGGVDPLEIDWVSHAANQHMTLVNLSLDHSNGIDTLTSIERGYLEGAGSGNDLDAGGFTIGPVWLVGQGGNDTLVGTDHDDTMIGGAGNDSITADAGDDLITGGDGSDAMIGGDGDDFYLFAGTNVIETDTVTEAPVAAGGIDRLDFSAIPASDSLTLDLDVNGSHGTRTVTIANANSLEQAFGGPGIDSIDGNGLANLLVGNAGGDNIDGEGGNDTIEGSAGTDVLEGGANDDLYVFESGWGSDSVTDSGGANDEFDFTALSANLTFNLGSVVVTQGGNTVTHLANNIEILDSGSGDDLFIFANGASLALGAGTIRGNGGDDTLDYQAYLTGVVVNLTANTATDLVGTLDVFGIETVLGGSGADDITGNNVGNLLIGNNGADTIDGAGGVDTIEGGGGGDSLEGGGGNDLITGGAGSDDLLGGPGNDDYFFANAIGIENDDIIELAGEGTDLVDFAALGATVALTLNLNTGAGTNGSRTLAVSAGQVEDIFGTSANDNLTGNAANNRLEGRNGNDTMLGLGGDDELIGGLDNDRYRFALAAGGDTAVITEHPSEGTDTLDFSAITVVDPTMDFARVDLDEGVGGVAGRVAEYGSDATRRVTASAGLMINFENIVGSSGNDVITGSDAPNTIGGANGNDEIHGADGNDTLDGGSGDDSLYGERNNDRLLGGTGTNHLEGGSHDDTYFYPVGATADDTLVEEPATVIDGSSVVGGIDLINLSALTAAVDLDLGTTAGQLVNPGLMLTLTDLGPPASSQNFENVLGSLTATNDLTGNDSDNVLTGGNLNDTLVGGDGTDDGNDLLTGGTGNDRLSGGANDDTLIRDAADNVTVDGGTGNDTLEFIAGGTLDLQSAAFLTGIEVMNFNNHGVTFRTNRTQLVALSDTDILTLNGGNLDTVNLETTPGSWTLSVDSLQSNTYTNTPPIMAVIQDGITIGLNVAPSPPAPSSPAPSPGVPAAVLVDSALSDAGRRAPMGQPVPHARLATRPVRTAVDAVMDEDTVASTLSVDRLRATRHRRAAGADANRHRDEILGEPLNLM